MLNDPPGIASSKIIAAAITVHKALGPGFLEVVYERALAIELDRRRIPFARQHSIDVRYEGHVVGRHRLDLLVDEQVVVELKAVREIDDVHVATMVSYLRAADLVLGLIINFAGGVVRIRRVVA